MQTAFSARDHRPERHRFDQGIPLDPSQYDFRGPQAVDADQYRMDPQGNRYTSGEVLDPAGYQYNPRRAARSGSMPLSP